MVKKRVKVTQEIFEDRFYKLYNKDDYEVVGKYINYKTKVAIKHSVCGKIWMVTPSDLLTKHPSCGNCIKRTHYTTKEYEEKVQKIIGNKYHVVSEYVDSHSKIKIHHDVCNSDYEVQAYSVLASKTRCPFCSNRASNGERIVGNILRSSEIKFYREYYTIIDGKKAYIDFVLPDLHVAIEYDGKQHYVKTGYSRDNQKEVDAGKHCWAKENGYVLVNIPYWYNTPDKIYNYLSSYLPLYDYDRYTNYYSDDTIRESSEYRLTHTQEQTAKKFNISISSVQAYFRLVYGTNYSEYRKRNK